MAQDIRLADAMERVLSSAGLSGNTKDLHLDVDSGENSGTGTGSGPKGCECGVASPELPGGGHPPIAAKPHSRPAGVFGPAGNTVRATPTCRNFVEAFDEVAAEDPKSPLKGTRGGVVPGEWLS